jgi:hypothetical protein
MDPEAQTNTWIRIRNTVKTPTGKIKKRKFEIVKDFFPPLFKIIFSF